MKNYEILKPETFLIYHVWYNSAGVANDLAGWTGNIHIYDRNDVLLASIVLTCNASGEIEGSSTTDSWTVGTYDYYMRLDDGAGRIVDLISGVVCVE